jgi:uncharacterized membrane protein
VFLTFLPIFLDSIRVPAHTVSTMKLVFYAVGMVFASILAPFVGLIIAFVTFFTSTLAFIRGFHLGMKINLFIKTAKKQPEQQDIWEKHINRIKNKKY